MTKNSTQLMNADLSAVVKRSLCVLLVTFGVSPFFMEAFGQSVLLADIVEREEPTVNEYSTLTSGKGRLYFLGNGDTELWTSSTTAEGTEDTRLLKKFVSASRLTVVGTRLYFVANDGVSGPELWKSDGTAAGTMRVKDIRPGATGSEPDLLTNVNGTLYFSANNGTNGRELWKSNGSPGGTMLVKDILPKTGNGNPTSLTAVNGILYFAANDGTNGIELWKSNGTADGTVMVKDIRPGTRVNSSPDNLVNVYGTLFFVAADATTGRELWKSNGTAGGTVRVKDILPGTNTSRISNTTAVYRTLFFSATDGIHGQELWKSDGTEGGTVMVKDMTPGPKGSQGTHEFSHPIANFTNIAGTLFFTAYRKDTYYIWKTNGTAQGTVPIMEASGPGIMSPKPRFTLMNNRIYFFNGSGYPYDPLGFWSMDRSGTDHQSYILEFWMEDAYNTYYPELALVGNTFYISGRPDSWYGFKLVKSDGTRDGSIFLDIKTTSEGGNPAEFTHFNGKLFFRADHSWYQQHDLWVTDGTPAGTTLFSTYDEEVDQLILVGSNLYATAVWGSSVYKTDLMTGNTERITSNYNAAPVNFFTSINATILFSNGDGELWKSNGTTEGTVLISDFHQITDMHVLNGKLVFRVTHEDGTGELWSSNGTGSGTVKIKTLHSGAVKGSSYNPTAIIGNTLYFVANDGTHGNEVWKSNGTAAGTLMVTDLRTTETGGAGPEYDIRNFAVFRDTLYISAMRNDGLWALYKTNGVASGTSKVQDINPVVHSVAYGDQLLLFTDEYTPNGNTKTKLWTTDGTAAGTELVHELDAVQGNFSHQIVNDLLYFSTLEGGPLWRTDGTTCGTFIIDTHGASPIAALNSTLIFGSYDQQAGYEPHAYNTAEAPESPCDNAMDMQLVASDKETSQEKLLTSYPNPFNNDFALRFGGSDGESAQVRVFTLYGKPVENISELKGNTDHRLGQTWRPGVYVVELITEAKVSRYRVVKE